MILSDSVDWNLKKNGRPKDGLCIGHPFMDNILFSDVKGKARLHESFLSQ